MRALALGLALAAGAWAGAPSAGSYGVLLLAHGGGAQWNAEAARIARSLSRQAPTELALGMADRDEIQAALERLAARRVSKVVAVPLFISSRSEVLDQTQYVLGLRAKPSETLKRAMAALPPEAMRAMHAMHGGKMPDLDARASTKLPVVMTKALDDDPVVADIELDRARALSKDPKRETVFLVAHGPVNDKENQDWLSTMRRVARIVKERGGFRDVQVATIRDDSPKPVKAAALRELRGRVRAAGKAGRAIVLPYLIARGGIEDHISAALAGLPFAWSGRTLAPDPRLARWASRQARAASK